MGWASIFRRRARVFAVALVVYLDYKAVQKRGKWMSKGKKTELWERAHDRNAKRVLRLILELKGLWVKLGQYLSTRADVLPEAYISRLRQLQDSLPPRPLKEVRQTIKKELGKPVDDIFQNFIESPLATASIAQVHRATLMNGEEVVVKVQHEGIKDVILEDLKNAKSIVDWIAWAEPQYDLSPVINEWCNEAPKELDFNLEAENTRSVSNNLCRKTENDNSALFDHVDVLIPEVIQSTEKVLILEFMDGIRLNDHEALEAHGVDKQNIVEEITRAYAHQIYVDGFFNGDPHPGNFLVSKHPPHRPILLDFGLTKSISSPMKVALAKMFLAAAEGDQVALLSAFAEMGLKLRVDLPDQSMEITNMIFRTTAPAAEALENMKAMMNQRKKNEKIVQEKLKLDKKEMKRFNPVDAFPGDAVIFFRVLNLLRGLSSMLDVRIVYLDIMRPFAETTLQGSIQGGSESRQQWIYPTKVLSDVESRLRQLLLELGKENILGVQICAYKDGVVVLDTAAGVLGKYDPRPVQPDSLFPVFSVTKGITAGMLHWLVDKGKVKLEDDVASVWPSFSINGKEKIKVHQVLNHTSGLHSAMSDIPKESPLLMSDWKECLAKICASRPETEPGSQQFYHYLSFGWLCGGIIEEASGKSFQEILEEMIIHPLNLEGELYIGTPPGVESRLATLSVDVEDLTRLSGFMTSNQQDLPSNFQLNNISDLVKGIPVLFNMLAIRRAIIPAANGHCSARALARYYAALVSSGEVPTRHTTNFETPLGTLPHIPKLPSWKKSKKGDKHKGMDKAEKTHDGKTNSGSQITSEKDFGSTANGYSEAVHANGQDKNISHAMYTNPKIHDAFMGVGDYEALAIPDGKFGLGFRRLRSSEGELTGFGHSGIGGSTGFCDIKHNFAMALTVNKMSLGGVSRRIIQFVCSELGVPVPEEFSASGQIGPDMQLEYELGVPVPEKFSASGQIGPDMQLGYEPSL